MYYALYSLIVSEALQLGDLFELGILLYVFMLCYYNIEMKQCRKK